MLHIKKIYNDILLLIFFICFTLSFVFEKQRMVVLVLTIISLASVFAMAIIYLFTVKKEFISIFLTAIILLSFSNGKYNFDVFIEHQTNYVYIVLAIILICSAYKTYRTYKSIKNFLIEFAIYVVMFFILFAGCDRYVNYGFDLSKEIHADLIIEKQIGDSYGLPGYYGYAFLEYKVKPNDFKIETIDISDEYKLNPGDSVKITYRKGFHTPLYSTEYDVFGLLPGPLFSNP